jgi:hypothetical protein
MSSEKSEPHREGRIGREGVYIVCGRWGGPGAGEGGVAIRGGGARAAAPWPPSRCLCRRSPSSVRSARSEATRVSCSALRRTRDRVNSSGVRVLCRVGPGRRPSNGQLRPAVRPTSFLFVLCPTRPRACRGFEIRNGRGDGVSVFKAVRISFQHKNHARSILFPLLLRLSPTRPATIDARVTHGGAASRKKILFLGFVFIS